MDSARKILLLLLFIPLFSFSQTKEELIKSRYEHKIADGYVISSVVVLEDSIYSFLKDIRLIDSVFADKTICLYDTPLSRGDVLLSTNFPVFMNILHNGSYIPDKYIERRMLNAFIRNKYTVIHGFAHWDISRISGDILLTTNRGSLSDIMPSLTRILNSMKRKQQVIQRTGRRQLLFTKDVKRYQQIFGVGFVF